MVWIMLKPEFNVRGMAVGFFSIALAIVVGYIPNPRARKNRRIKVRKL